MTNQIIKLQIGDRKIEVGAYTWKQRPNSVRFDITESNGRVLYIDAGSTEALGWLAKELLEALESIVPGGAQ